MRNMVKPGDLLEVEETDDGLIPIGSHGVVNGHFRDRRVEVTFNYTTPWLMRGTPYIDASGGPVRMVLLSHITRKRGSRVITFHDLRPKWADPRTAKDIHRRVTIYGVRLSERRRT